MIYLIICKTNNTCKIGYSTKPNKRLKELQTSNAYKLELLYAIEGTIIEEQFIHNKFNHYKLEGEWFSYNTDIKEYFEKNNVLEEIPIKLSFEILPIFNNMEQSEIRVFSFLLQYADGVKFSINKPMRLEIAKVTTLNERTIYNVVKVLEAKKLIFKHDTGAYQLNPRYVFKGSSKQRDNNLKTIIELGCKDC